MRVVVRLVLHDRLGSSRVKKLAVLSSLNVTPYSPAKYEAMEQPMLSFLLSLWNSKRLTLCRPSRLYVL